MSLLSAARRPPLAFGWLTEVGGLALMLGRALARSVRRPLGLSAITAQIEALGVRSLAIATLTGTFAGLVISVQFAFFFARFGMQQSVGKVVVLTLFRELAPVLTALTVGARIGSGITAELGSMKVTEQLDAIRMLGADPLKKLVAPRILACALVLPALTVLSDLFGLVGGAWVVSLQYDVSMRDFLQTAVRTAQVLDFTSGVIKAMFFGLIIGTVGCFKGFGVKGGTEGVGVATTETVALASVLVCICDFLLTKLLLIFS